VKLIVPPPKDCQRSKSHDKINIISRLDDENEELQQTLMKEYIAKDKYRQQAKEACAKLAGAVDHCGKYLKRELKQARDEHQKQLKQTCVKYQKQMEQTHFIYQKQIQKLRSSISDRDLEITRLRNQEQQLRSSISNRN
jgi:hypothetical protein